MGFNLGFKGLIKDVLKGLDRELTAPYLRQLVCYKWYVGPWA